MVSLWMVEPNGFVHGSEEKLAQFIAVLEESTVDDSEYRARRVCEIAPGNTGIVDSVVE